MAFIFISASIPLQAATVTSTGSGLWSDPSSWIGGVVPVDGDDIIIAAGSTLIIDGNPDIPNDGDGTYTDVTIVINGTLNMDSQGAGFGYTVGNLSLSGTSGISLGPTGNISESVDALEGASTITLNGVVLWAACNDEEPLCSAIVNGLVDPDPELYGNQSGPSLLPLNNNPLPVEYLGINAEIFSDYVELKWSTATEIDNHKFEIERADEDQIFHKIGEKLGYGDSQIQRDYTFRDQNTKNLNSRYIFYRLKQIDFDGAFEYSQVIFVGNISALGNEMSIAPNPYSTDYSIQYQSAFDENIFLKVYDLKGQLIFEKRLNALKGANNFNIDGLAHLEPGIYITKLQNRTNTLTSRLIKSNALR